MNKNKYSACPFCGENECKDETIDVVEDCDAVLTEVIRCEYCGVTFIMDGVDFNIRGQHSIPQGIGIKL
jgi:uncharacterized Zn finger protein